MRQLIPLAAMFLVLSSCSKSDSGTSTTKTQLITSANWKYEAGGIDADRNGTIDITFEAAGAPPACVLDNIGRFYSNGTGASYEGATKCVVSAPDSTSFSWSFGGGETSLNLSGSGIAGATGQFTIKDLSATSLKLTKDTSIAGFTASLIVNLKH